MILLGNIGRDWAICFGSLVAVFLPLPYSFFTVQKELTDAIFGVMVKWMSKNLFGFELTTNSYYSDSVSTFSLYIILAILSLILAVIISKSTSSSNRRTIAVIGTLVVTYFLSYQMLRYGVDKIFYGQFYEPTEFVMNSKFMDMDRDILYWSVMGLSPGYSMFLGVIEVCAGLLIFWWRTRIIGLILTSGILLNVIAINFGFDISVKMFSCFLLGLTLMLLAPIIRPIMPMFSELGSIKFKMSRPLKELIPSSTNRSFVQFMILIALSADALAPFMTIEGVAIGKEVDDTTPINDTLRVSDQEWHWFIESVK